jgi:hypothetical protein
VFFVFAVVLVVQPLFESHAALAFAAPCCGRLFSYFTVYFVLGFYLKDCGSLFTQYARKPLVILSSLVFVCAMESVEVTRILRIPIDKYVADAGEIFGVINIVENTAIVRQMRPAVSERRICAMLRMRRSALRPGRAAWRSRPTRPPNRLEMV